MRGEYIIVDNRTTINYQRSISKAEALSSGGYKFKTGDFLFLLMRTHDKSNQLHEYLEYLLHAMVKATTGQNDAEIIIPSISTDNQSNSSIAISTRSSYVAIDNNSYIMPEENEYLIWANSRDQFLRYFSRKLQMINWTMLRELIDGLAEALKWDNLNRNSNTYKNGLILLDQLFHGNSEIGTLVRERKRAQISDSNLSHIISYYTAKGDAPIAIALQQIIDDSLAKKAKLNFVAEKFVKPVEQLPYYLVG